MRILLMCEGTNEETLISALLDANAFKFTKASSISSADTPNNSFTNCSKFSYSTQQ